jgi:hypothetical protein
MQDMLLATIEEEAYGEHAKKKRARHRQDLVDGNMKSYSRWLNNPERMDDYQEYLGLSAVLSEIQHEEDEKRNARAANKKSKEDEKRKKREEREADEEQRKQERLPGIQEDMKGGKEHLQALLVKRLKVVLVYGLERPRSDVNKLKKPELLAAIFEALGFNDDLE